MDKLEAFSQVDRKHFSETKVKLNQKPASHPTELPKIFAQIFVGKSISFGKKLFL